MTSVCRDAVFTISDAFLKTDYFMDFITCLQVFDFTVALKIHSKKITLYCCIYHKTTQSAKFSAENGEFQWKNCDDQPFAEELCF